jgi:hypothetical protein
MESGDGTHHDIASDVAAASPHSSSTAPRTAGGLGKSTCPPEGGRGRSGRDDWAVSEMVRRAGRISEGEQPPWAEDGSKLWLLETVGRG